MPEPTQTQRDIQRLEGELKRLETEYALFFRDRRPKPPTQARSRFEAAMKRLETSQFDQAADRFRFNTLQARFVVYAQLWERALRAKEEGRPGPYAGRDE